MVFNRDVNLNKKTKPLNVFEEDKNIIGGRDIEGNLFYNNKLSKKLYYIIYRKRNLVRY